MAAVNFRYVTSFVNHSLPALRPQDTFDLDHFLFSSQKPEGENPYTKSQTKGAKALMEEHLKALKMKTSGLDNAERCKRLLVHYKNPDKADPTHYKRIPQQFMHRLDFWFELSPFVRFLNQPQPRMCIIFIFTYILHYMSSELYVTSIFGLPRCSVYKAQPHCTFLHTIQNYTFSSLDDFGKIGITLFLNMMYDKIIPAPRQR